MVNNKNNTPLLVMVLLLAAFSIGSSKLSATIATALPVVAVNTTSANNLALSVMLASELAVAVRDITWRIRAADGGYEQRYIGASPALSVPSGQYDVTLSIGAYTATQTIRVLEGKLSKLAFTANIGRLRISSPHPAAWKITACQGAAAGKVVSSSANSKILNTFLTPGEYEVLATRGDGIQHSQRLHVTSGKLSAAAIQMPSGKVTLIATLGNGPALRPMSWVVYRLDEGKQTIATPRRHSANLEVAPGHYEAVATLDGQERRRSFTVLAGTSNRIVIAMD